MHQTPWLLLDTETNGIKPPIYVVELAAQRMRGWEPEGAPFVRLLNHGAAIAPESSRVNGYTPEILERDGEPPHAVYEAFAEYAGERPLVSYNLSYDLDQVLRPEWQRLERAPIGQAGLCAWRLTQRLLDPVPAGNCKLQTLRQYYRLPTRGAHTALGDVETVVDLLQQVLRPLAEARGLTTWAALSAYAAETWFPSRLAFGKFKGRNFREARHDVALRDWLEWLAASNTNPRSAEMGRWYLDHLEIDEEPAPTIFPSMAVDAAVVDEADMGAALVVYRDLEREKLNELIESARTRLAELEAELARDHQAVAVMQARLFERLRPLYQQRDELQIIINYRRHYLDLLMVEGEEVAEEIAPEYEQARAETEREYEEAATDASEQRELTESEQGELKTLFRKLVRLYHPDRYAQDPVLQPVYEHLTREINQARDQGNIECLREIAHDPNGFLVAQGLSCLNFSDELDDDIDQVGDTTPDRDAASEADARAAAANAAALAQLRRRYDSLQVRILTTLEDLARLHESSDYELYRLSQEDPDLWDAVAEQQASGIRAELATLEQEARQLAEEIDMLTGAADPF